MRPSAQPRILCPTYKAMELPNLPIRELRYSHVILEFSVFQPS